MFYLSKTFGTYVKLEVQHCTRINTLQVLGIRFWCALSQLSVDTWHCSAAEHDVVATVSTGGPAEHNTRTLQKYDIKGANFCMYDMWGLNKKSCGQEQVVLPALLDGWLPRNWSMNHQLREHKRVLLAKGSTRYRRRVHGVLFFISVDAVRDDPELKTIKGVFQEVRCIQSCTTILCFDYVKEV